MPRVQTQHAPTIGHANATYIASASDFQQTLTTALSVHDVVFIRATPTSNIYNMSDTYAIPSGKSILGQPDIKPTLRLASGVNKTVLTNANALIGGITTDVTLKSLTIDQQGALQTAGGGIVPTGIQGWVLEDIIIKKSYRFNFLALHQSVGVSNKTGVVTFTNASSTLVGVGTLFTTELTAGDILKSAGGQFGRVQSITNNTQLTLTIPWGYTTESSVTYKKIQPNSGCRFTRVRFEGTLAAADENGGIDAAGFGLLDDSTVEYCEGFDTTDGGCAFVPDHCRNSEFNYLVGRDTGNSGISLETCEDCTVDHPVCNDNTDNGTQLISGTSRCTVIDGSGKGNVKDAFVVTYNTTSAGVPSDNVFRRCTGESNDGYAFRVNGADNTEVDDATGKNNNTGGLIVNQINSRVPNATNVHHSEFYDDRGGSKSQDRGVYIVSSTNAIVDHVTALDSLHVIAGIVDTGTNSTLSSNTT